MKRSIKKVVAAVVVSSMLFSFAACSNKANEEVVEAADSFASAVLKRDSKKIYELTNVDKKKQDDSLFNYDDNMDGKNIKEAILDNIEAEVDEESVEASSKDGEGSVDVIFMIPDYETVFDETEASNEDDLIKEIKKAEKNEVKVTVEFEKEDDEWLVSNAPKVFDKVFGDIATVSVPAFIDLSSVNSYWYGADQFDGNEAWYTNTTYIDIYVYGDFDYTTVSYVVELDGQIIYESYMGDDECYITSYGDVDPDDFGHFPEGDYKIIFSVGDVELDPFIAHVTSEVETFEPSYAFYGGTDKVDGNEAWYTDVKFINAACYGGQGSTYCVISLDGRTLYTTDDGVYDAVYGDYYGDIYGGDNSVDSNGLIPEGDYVFTFYNNGVEVEPAAICHVTNTQGGTSGVNSENYGIFDPMVEFFDDDFEDMVQYASWYDPDEDLPLDDNSVYENGVSYVSYWLEVPVGTNDEIYYAYYFVDDPDTEPDYPNPTYAATITPAQHVGAYCYDIDCNEAKTGYYYLFIGDNENFDNVYLISLCEVK
ncbi:MAG: hypothetical protein MJ093_05745 [Saccharofermentans sp.]|nr:hypothetical protein [Saccharofermentans sp.]